MKLQTIIIAIFIILAISFTYCLYETYQDIKAKETMEHLYP